MEQTSVCSSHFHNVPAGDMCQLLGVWIVFVLQYSISSLKTTAAGQHPSLLPLLLLPPALSSLPRLLSSFYSLSAFTSGDESTYMFDVRDFIVMSQQH